MTRCRHAGCKGKPVGLIAWCALHRDLIGAGCKVTVTCTHDRRGRLRVEYRIHATVAQASAVLTYEGDPDGLRKWAKDNA